MLYICFWLLDTWTCEDMCEEFQVDQALESVNKCIIRGANFLS